MPSTGRDRRLPETVDVVRRDDLADARISGSYSPVELEGERDLVVGRERGEVIPPQIERRRLDAVR